MRSVPTRQVGGYEKISPEGNPNYEGKAKAIDPKHFVGYYRMFSI
jgi:hypothetical protein